MLATVLRQTANRVRVASKQGFGRVFWLFGRASSKAPLDMTVGAFRVPARLGALVQVVITFFAVNALVRLALLFFEADAGNFQWARLPGIFIVGAR
ncbi:MAG: hypothetical protein VW257_04305 [Quisquiliibacterium sp.]